MKNILKAILVWALAICAILHFSSCNPVKQVLKDKNKLDQVAKVVIRSGYCINDTTRVDSFETVKITVKDSLVHDTLPGTIVTLDGELRTIDTVFSSGAHVRITPQGVVSVSCPVKIVDSVKTVIQKNYIRDVAKEKLLQEDISDQLGKNNDLTKQLSETKKKLATRTIEFWGLITLLVASVVIKFYTNIKKFLPFLP